MNFVVHILLYACHVYRISLNFLWLLSSGEHAIVLNPKPTGFIKIKHPFCPISVPVQTFTELCWSLGWLSVPGSQCHLMKHFFVDTCSHFFKKLENNFIHFFLKEMKEFTCHYCERIVLLMLVITLYFSFMSSFYLFLNSTVLDSISTTQMYVCYATLCNLVRLQSVTQLEH